jgi:hypothetical protein
LTNTFNITATATTDTGQVSNAVWNSLRSSHTGAGSFGESDTGINDRLNRIASDTDTGIKDGVWDSATRTLTANTNLSGLAVNVTQIVADTGAASKLQQTFLTVQTNWPGINVAQITTDTNSATRLQQAFALTPTYWQEVNLHQIRTDTGAADRLLKLTGSQLKTDGTFDTGTGQLTNTFNITASATTDTGQVSNAVWNSLRSAHIGAGSFGESDTGINNRLSVIAADTDTGIKDGVWDSAARTLTANTNLGGLAVNVTQIVADTGAASKLQQSHLTTPTYWQEVNLFQVRGDTGAADRLLKLTGSQLKTDGTFDTGTGQLTNTFNITASATVDTGVVSNVVWNSLRSAHTGAGSFGESDTGINNRLSVIAADTDTGIQSSVHVTSFSDTGVNNRLSVIAADTDTGIQSSVHVTSFSDTGVNNRLAVIAADTDTGIQSSVTATNVTGFSDTGVNNRLSVIAADTDTGIQSSVNVTTLADTGVNERLTAIETKTGSLTFTVANQVDSNIQFVNDVQIQGIGDTGTGNTWRPV